MGRILVLIGLSATAGLTLLFSELRWFRRPRLADRLSPYVPGSPRAPGSRMFSVETFREVVAPLSEMLGERIARAFGVNEDLSVRLRRVHSPLDVATFRVRQIGTTATAMVAGSLVALAFDLSPPLAMLAVAGSALLGFLVQEQRVASASADWQRRVFLELPVVAEQLGMLTAAGWSLSAAIRRISSRGSGNCAADLHRVTERIGQGLSEADALQEWARLVDIDALDRLVAILSLNREAADLGRLVSEEARAIRREAQRELIEAIEQRNQQVWIPVTVAALIPGALLMGVPFIDALTLFSSS
ncbi:MAG: type II secretion system F family protein [Acidimicrobiales bacterium]